MKLSGIRLSKKIVQESFTIFVNLDIIYLIVGYSLPILFSLSKEWRITPKTVALVDELKRKSTTHSLNVSFTPRSLYITCSLIKNLPGTLYISFKADVMSSKIIHVLVSDHLSDESRFLKFTY